jgi:hypothetical protein
MGVPRRTRPAGTIQSLACDEWNASAHHTSSAAPPSPTATRHAAVPAMDDNGDAFAMAPLAAGF